MKQLGLAKTQFHELHKRTPWISKHKPFFDSNWPTLDQQLAHNRISYLDYVLTHRLLRDNPESTEKIALFLCHLILAAQKGHLCINVCDSTVTPSVDELWNNETEKPLASEEIESIQQLILEGSKVIPDSLISIYQHNHSFYLQRNWVMESLFLEGLAKQCQNKPYTKIELDLEALLNEKKLNTEQAQAIKNACLYPISIISGGPGTGKTYTAGQLIRVIWNHLSHVEQSSFQIVLAAPTGKAAANLQKSLTNAISSLEHFPVLQAKTLHSLLNLSHKDTEIRLNADLIVVDESSMIDLKTMTHLFKALKKGCRLILLGDPFQLPAVESGSLFVDLIESKIIPHTELNTCLRTELTSIIHLAKQIKEGAAEETLTTLNLAPGGILRPPFPEDPKEAQKELINSVSPLFLTFSSDPRALEAFNTIRLLSPVRKGPFGVDILNQLIWDQVSESAPSQGWVAIPIMIVTNDYRQDLFNGETGVLMRKLPLEANQSADYALFHGRTSEHEFRRFPSLLLPKYDYAYCLSVHKSQGSEFDRVILVLPEGSDLFGREVFYTAVTRARRQIEIYGSDETILKTVARQANRLSGIQERITHLALPSFIC